SVLLAHNPPRRKPRAPLQTLSSKSTVMQGIHHEGNPPLARRDTGSRQRGSDRGLSGGQQHGATDNAQSGSIAHRGRGPVARRGGRLAQFAAIDGGKPARQSRRRAGLDLSRSITTMRYGARSTTNYWPALYFID